MDIQELKQKIINTIEDNSENIISMGEKIYNNPELGYKEFFTTKFVAEKLENLGLEVSKNIAVSGCSALAPGKSEGPNVCIMGELDAIIVKQHKDADKVTGAVHACGHNIQIAAMMGAATGLIKSGVLAELTGSVTFLAVPAEEYIELDYRSTLRDKGEIKYFGGKQELIQKGFFDNVDISIMVHALDLSSLNGDILVGPKGNGFIGKNVHFIGKESHAGSAPEKGINALNAAMLAMNNIHAQRETFSDNERIRVHPIITNGGDIVNVVPANVTMETYVRGRTLNGIADANEKVNRALIAGAMAVGANIRIDEIPGYFPLLNNEDLDEIFRQNAENIFEKDRIVSGGDFTGSFDFGDISHLMPALHPMIGGVKGGLHTKDFHITDPYLAYIAPAKLMALTVVDLLFDNAAKAQNLLADFKPRMTKEEYLDFMEKSSRVIER
ncbi:MAG: amidohydrolase [Spirochaetaceae bacterium]|nr:amidohydrolase [Spirochaetaceae bacterium]